MEGLFFKENLEEGIAGLYDGRDTRRLELVEDWFNDMIAVSIVACGVSLVPSARVPAFLEKVRRLYFLPLLQHTSMPENTSETSLLDQSSAASDGVPEAEGKCTLVEGGETFLFVTIPSRGASYLEVTQDWHV